MTDQLPRTRNAKTWDGPPVQRSHSGRWSGQLNFAGHKHTVGTFDTPYEWGLAATRSS